MNYHLPAIIFLIPFGAAICMPLVGLRNPRWSRPLALAAGFALCVAATLNCYAVWSYGNVRYDFGGWPISSPPLGIEWVNDELASVMVVAFSYLASVCLIFGGPVMPRPLGDRVVLYHTLVLMLMAGLIGILFTGDIFNLFVFLELAALSAYALVGLGGDRALIAAFRYLILGTLGASVYLLGVVFLYAVTGTLNMADLAGELRARPDLLTSKAVIGGTVFMFIGLGIKMALFPFHGWLPEAYTRAPDAISPILAALMTKVALYAWVRITYWVLDAHVELGRVEIFTVLSALGSVATVAGALLALGQQNVKRMFAYGGVSHVGLILIGVSQGNATGFAGGMFYMINDAVMQAGLFFIAGAAFYLYRARTLEEFSGLRNSPLLMAALIVFALSMIGIPPTGGFFGKWHIILGALESRDYFAVAAVIVSTVLTMAYFQKLFVCIFGERKAGPQPPTADPPWELRLSIGVTAVAVIVLGLGSDPIIRLLRDAAASVGL